MYYKHDSMVPASTMATLLSPQSSLALTIKEQEVASSPTEEIGCTLGRESGAGRESTDGNIPTAASTVDNRPKTVTAQSVIERCHCLNVNAAGYVPPKSPG